MSPRSAAAHASSSVRTARRHGPMAPRRVSGPSAPVKHGHLPMRPVAVAPRGGASVIVTGQTAMDRHQQQRSLRVRRRPARRRR